MHSKGITSEGHNNQIARKIADEKRTREQNTRGDFQSKKDQAYAFLDYLIQNGDIKQAEDLQIELARIEESMTLAERQDEQQSYEYKNLITQLSDTYQGITNNDKTIPSNSEAKSRPFANIAKRAKDMKSAEHDLSAIVDIAKVKIVENYLAYLVNKGGDSRTRAEAISDDLDTLAHRQEAKLLRPSIESVLKEYQEELEKRKKQINEKQQKLEKFEKDYGFQKKTLAEIQGVQQDQQMSLTEWSKVDKLINNESSVKWHLDNLKTRTHLEDSDLEQIDLTFSIEELEDGTVVQKVEDFIKNLEVEEADLKQRRKKFGEKLKSALDIGSKLDKEHTRIYR